jgi:hypothetical protein
MKVSALILALSAVGVFAFALPSEAAAQGGSAGIIEKINGTAYLRQTPVAAPEKLDPRSDAARRLYPGEQVRCARRSCLTLLLGRRRLVVRGADWFTIPPAPSSRSDLYNRMLHEYGRVGGIERGDSSQVFAPSDHSVVTPGRFIIRWAPSPSGCVLSLTIRDVGAGVVWREENVRGALGSLESASARRRLTTYRDLARQGTLIFTLNDTCGGAHQVTFTLLSAEKERLLEQDIALWDKEDGALARRLGRAAVFSQYRLYPQAADEYEAALMTEPHSRDLLTRTILAHRRTGNLTRAEDLERRLPKVAGTR